MGEKSILNYQKLLRFVFILGCMLITATSAFAADPFKEVNGLLVIEAENYHSKTSNGAVADWFIFPTSSATPTPDHDGLHATGAGNGKYVEILPDTRVTHDDPLYPNVNIFTVGNNAPRLNYRVLISSPGRYYVRGRSYSTSTEDNGVHFGVDNTWPVSGTALQWCGTWNAWVWSGNRRTLEVHCGIANALYLDLTAGEHTIMMAMREDGFEMDRFVLTKDSSYFPSGIGPAESPRTTGGGTPTNIAPVVNAGADQTVEISESASLNGSVTDDGLPNGVLTSQWSMVSGPGSVTFQNASAKVTTASFSVVGSYVLQLTATDGALSSNDRIGITVTETSTSTGAFNQGTDTNGLVVIEAENFDATAEGGNHSWIQVNKNGTPAMEAVPESGALVASNYVNGSPYLRFKVNFQKTGTHYVWLRGYCTGGDNSGHVGLDGKAVTTAQNMNLPVTQNWVWSKTRDKGAPATLSIANTGIHTIEVYMREDGLVLDRLLLTTSSSYTPTGVGPAQSSRSDDPAAQNQAPVVNAGADLTADLSETVQLNGQVTDDGLPTNTLTTEWRMLSGPGQAVFSNTAIANPTVSFNQTGVYVLELSVSDSALTTTDKIGITVANGGTTTNAFQQDSGSNGLVVMEAEHFDANVTKAAHSWIAINQGGVQAMEATPDNGARITSNYVSGSPYLRFNVNFVKTGVHYVWLRGYSTGNDNSAHVGFDAQAVSTADNITLAVKQNWVWSGLADGIAATLNVTKTGLHTVEIYMREDGLILDKIVLTTSVGYIPTASGPAESTRN